MASGIQVSGGDALKLRPESGAVQENMHPDFCHCAGLDQFALNRAGGTANEKVAPGGVI